MFYSFDETQKFTKETSDAAVKSFSALVKGVQTASNEVVDYSKKSIEDNTSVFDKMTGAKSIDKAFEIQADYFKAAYETYVARATKISEIVSGAAQEAYKPVEAAVAKAAPKAAK